MKLYFAGYENYETLTDKSCRPEVKNVLISYYCCKDKEKFKRFSEQGKNVFLDSGAFSAFTQKDEIDIELYMQFIREVQDYVDVYVSLDVIGSGQKSLENYKLMCEEGFNPIPCFHPQEDFSILDYYCEHADYVGLGGIARFTNALKSSWYNRVYSRHPKHKYHGFAQTSYNLLFKYPWFSVDSTSWFQGGKFGRVMLPTGFVVDMSEKSKMANTCSLEIVKKYYPKLNTQKLIESYQYRNSINAFTYLKIEEEVTKRKKEFNNIQKNLFNI